MPGWRRAPRRSWQRFGRWAARSLGSGSTVARRNYSNATNPHSGAGRPTTLSVSMAQVQATEAGSLRYASARGRWVLLATVLGSAVVMLDGTVVNVALRAIGRDLKAGIDGLQWTVSGYLLTLSALILLGGALGDRFGRRRVFVIGVIWFAAASLVCGIAPNLEALVAARVLQGIGGALLTPGSLAILEASFY